MKIAHIADCHLGNSQYRLRARKLDYFKAFEKIFKIIRNENIDIVVIAGDLFDSVHPDVETILRTKKIMSTVDIPILIIPGNHDKISSLTKITPIQLLDLKNVYPFIKTKIVTVKGFKFLGISRQVTRQEMSTLLNKIKDKQVDFLIYHGMVNDMHNDYISRFFNKENPSIKQFAGKFKYVFLGDIHIYSHDIVNGTLVAYPSSITYNNRTEIKNGNRGFIIYDVDNNSIKHIPIKIRNNVVLFNPTLEEIDQIEEGSLVYIESDDFSKLDVYDKFVNKDKFLYYRVQYVTSPDIIEEEVIGDVEEQISVDDILTSIHFPKKLKLLVKNILDTSFDNLSSSEITMELDKLVKNYIKSNEITINDVIWERS